MATCPCCVPSVTPEVSRISTTCGDPVAILVAPGWGVATKMKAPLFKSNFPLKRDDFRGPFRHSQAVSPVTLQVTLPLPHYVQQIHPSRIWSKVAVKRARLTLVWQGFQRRRGFGIYMDVVMVMSLRESTATRKQ